MAGDGSVHGTMLITKRSFVFEEIETRLPQDLAMMASLGIEHVERNGHHYYRGLSLWPADWQDTALAAHGDPYTRHREGFACLKIREGRVALDSVNTVPLRVKPLFDPSRFDGQPMP